MIMNYDEVGELCDITLLLHSLQAQATFVERRLHKIESWCSDVTGGRACDPRNDLPPDYN